jgi:hypothetical protein
MWDPTEFYDDLEHSIFKIMLTCGTKVDLLRYIWRHKTSMEQGTLGYSTNHYDKSIFCHYICTKVEYYDEISQERHKSITPKCGCVTKQRFSCSVRQHARGAAHAREPLTPINMHKAFDFSYFGELCHIPPRQICCCQARLNPRSKKLVLPHLASTCQLP